MIMQNNTQISATSQLHGLNENVPALISLTTSVSALLCDSVHFTRFTHVNTKYTCHILDTLTTHNPLRDAVGQNTKPSVDNVNSEHHYHSQLQTYAPGE